MNLIADTRRAIDRLRGSVTAGALGTSRALRGVAFAIVLSGAASAQLAYADSNACPTVGAIRWDAWFGERGIPGKAVEKTLGPRQWQYRAPACGRVKSDSQVEIDCTSAEQMALEIREAREAGIGYWAFVTYPEDNPMNIGLQTYLANADPKKVRFAVISEFEKWLDAKSYRPVLERYVRLIANPTYQLTPDGRPLFYIAFITDRSLNFRFGDRPGFKNVLDEFRAAVRATGRKDPYIVLLDADAKRASSFIRDLGLDAVSAYAVADNRVKAGTFKQLTTLVERFWTQAEAEHLPLVPIVMAGWDRRPRVMNPVPWEGSASSPVTLENYFDAPTDEELAVHLGDALRRAKEGPSRATAQTVLIYAWNEFDEGGWIAPTIGDADGRLAAVRNGISSGCPVTRPPSR